MKRITSEICSLSARHAQPSSSPGQPICDKCACMHEGTASKGVIGLIRIAPEAIVWCVACLVAAPGKGLTRLDLLVAA